MIPINTKQSKDIIFSYHTAGVEPQDIRGALRMTIENVEYGFPIAIVDDRVIAKIPALETIIADDILRENKIVPVMVEIIADDTRIIPWKDQLRIEVPIKVEATLIEHKDGEIEKPEIKMELIDEVDGDECLSKKQKDKLPDNIKKKIIKKKSKLAEKLGL